MVRIVEGVLSIDNKKINPILIYKYIFIHVCVGDGCRWMVFWGPPLMRLLRSCSTPDTMPIDVLQRGIMHHGKGPKKNVIDRVFSGEKMMD